jgi:hypothetical protein
MDDRLTPVKNYLMQKGCQVINIDDAQNRKVDAVVLSGQDMNLLGIQDIMIDAPVVSAQGMTPEEIWKDIQQITRLKQ